MVCSHTCPTMARSSTATQACHAPAAGELAPHPRRAALDEGIVRLDRRLPPGAKFPSQFRQRAGVGGRGASNLDHGRPLVEERGRRLHDLVGPFVAAVELQRPDVDARLTQPLDVALEDRLCIPLVARAVTDQRAAHARQDRGVELRRHVAADGDHAVHRPRRRGRGSERHRDALREAGQHQPRRARVLALHRVDHRRDVGQIVGDRELAILPRHPARDHFVRAALVEAVEPLNRDEQPAVRAGNATHPLELRRRRLRRSRGSRPASAPGRPTPAARADIARACRSQWCVRSPDHLDGSGSADLRRRA